MTEQPIANANVGSTRTSGSLSRRAGRKDWQALSGRGLSIQAVPMPLPGKERAAWRVTALALCLAGCRGQSATVEQLHVLSWALRDVSNGARLLEAWDAHDPTVSLRAWDTALDDTLKLAQAAGLVDAQPNGRRKLTDLGKTLVAAVRNSDDLMIEEQQLLAGLGQISEIAMWRRLGTPPKAPRRTDGEK
ncbi:hypothetical protein [Actinoplanes sp. NPDC049265]|uniref:hypothetical protein n=1 Tax=Actinoplanes sp. NPDC049265 TaxID=3363902 RepID=UPI003721ACB1